MLLNKLPTPLLYLCALLYVPNVQALQCVGGQPIEHTFKSGASWTFCAVLDEHHALELQQLHYRAPGDSSRQVLKQLHLGQVLLHYHDKRASEALIGENKLGGPSAKTLNETSCDGELLALGNSSPKLCSFIRNEGLLAKYNLRPGLHSKQYHLFSVSEFHGLTFKVQIGLSEDGRIKPSVALSGQTSSTSTDSRFGNVLNNPVTNEAMTSTQASVLYTWRMAFAMNDDGQNDTVEEFNFKLDPSLGNRRPMKVTPLTTETLRNKDRDQFRGWRIKDTNGSGYYLDPQNSGFGYSDWDNNWTQFDLAVTAFKECERHSYVKSSQAENGIHGECEGSLDDFVNGETMLNTDPVIWYSLSRVFRPRSEDYPIISSMQTEFEIVPFDWTATSPFEVVK